MKIDKIHIKNFKSISELEIDFSVVKGLWELNGPVGAGKTSVGEALLFGLFGNLKDKNNSDLLQWGKKKAEVELLLNTKGHNLEIKRTLTKSSSTLEVFSDGKPVPASNKKALQQALEEEYYDISKLTLELLCIISFNGFKSLSRLSTADARKFLDQTFGLDVITEWHESSLQEKKSSYADVQDNKSEQRIIDAQIQKIKEWVPVDEEGLKKKILAKSEEYKKLTEEKDKITKEWNSKIEELTPQLTECNKELSRLKTLGSEKKRIIEFISKGVCPTCHQAIDQSPLPQHKEELKSLARDFKVMTAKYNDIESEKKQINESYTEPLNNIRKKVEEVIRQKSELSTELSHSTKCEGEISQLTESLEALKEKEDELLSIYEKWNELASYLSNQARQVVFDSCVPHINKYANAFLARLGQSYSISVDSSFKCSISNNLTGNEFPVTSLSTGQSKMLDMILILSILEVLLSKVDFNVCFCDELLSNMDVDLRNEMCKLLKENLRKDQTMLLISHAPLDKDIMDGTLSCHLSNLESVYTLQ